MPTLHTTSRGPAWEPIQVEVWSHDGQRLGHLGNYEDMTFTWVDRGPDLAVIEAALSPVVAPLIPCDGTALIAAHYGGRTHLSVPVEAQVASGETPSVAMATITSAGGWGLLDGQVIPPTLGEPLTEQLAEDYTLSGPLETVIKSLITQGAERTGHPVVVMPDQGRGPTVTATGAWETVGETVRGLLAYSGYRLDMSGWVPGDPQPDPGLQLSLPCVVAEFMPYRERQGLVWSVAGGDITEWSLTHKRAQATRAVVGYETDDMARRRYLEVQGQESRSPWSIRESYVEQGEYKDVDEREPDPYRVLEAMESTGRSSLAKGGPALDMNVTMEVSHVWDFGRDSGTPRYFDMGDRVEVVLPVLGNYSQVITEVSLHVTPREFSITPTVSTPDTLDTDIYAVLADLTQRVTELERN